MSSRSLACLLATLGACSLTAKLPGLGSSSAKPPIAAASPGSPRVASPTTGSPSAGTPAATSPPADAAATQAPPVATNKERSDGLPPPLVELVHETYFPDPDRPGNEIGPRNNNYDLLRAPAAAFEAGWKDYEQRAAVVGEAVTRAAELEKAGKLADARAALEQVITAEPIDDKGAIDPRARKPLDPRDAELPAIDAWVRIVAALGDRRALVEAGHHYWIRRKVRDRDTEMWFWLSAAADNTIRNLVSENSPGIRQKVWKIWDEAAKVRGASPFDTEGQRTASTYFSSLAQFGLSWTVVDVEKGKKGDWVMVNVEPAEIGERDIKHASTEQWRVPTRCWDTNKISYWDGNGHAVYETACDYTYHERPIRLHAKLAEPSQAWARGRDHVLVVGKLASPGPTWELTDAFIPDLRFSEGGLLF